MSGISNQINENNKLKIFAVNSANPKGIPVIETRLPSSINFSMSSKYREFGRGEVAGLLGTIMNTLGISMSFKWMDLRIWESTSPIEFKIPIKLVAFNDAFTEVFQPAMRLLGLGLPRPGPIGALIPPGVDILTLVNRQWDNVLNAVFNPFETIESETPMPSGNMRKQYKNDLIETSRRSVDLFNVFDNVQGARNLIFGKENFGRTLTIHFGNLLKFKEMIITDCEVVWGGEGNQSSIPLNSQGFPMVATVLLSVRGSRIFTKDKYDNDSYSEVEQLDFSKVDEKMAINPDEGIQNTYETYVSSAVKNTSETYKRILKINNR